MSCPSCQIISDISASVHIPMNAGVFIFYFSIFLPSRSNLPKTVLFLRCQMPDISVVLFDGSV